MASSESTFNLTALAERLLLENRLPSLTRAIQRARDLHSLCSDLDMALESLDALDELLKDSSPTSSLTNVIIKSALLSHAIILYARATKTKSEERRGFDLRPRFDEQQKTIHAELCDLRDRAIAHFGSGGSYTDVWQAELVVFQESSKGHRVGVLTRRKAVDKKLAGRARSQIELARRLLDDLRSTKLNDVTTELNNLATDEGFVELLRECHLNLDAVLSSSEAAEAARSSVEVGYARGAVDHD